VALVILLAGVVTMPARYYRGDAAVVRLATVRLINEGRIDLPPAQARAIGERGQYFFENTETGRWYSKYGILNTLLYVPPLLLERAVCGELSYDESSRVRVLALNLYYALVSALIAIYLWRLAARYTTRPVLLWFYVLSCIYGTFCCHYLRTTSFEAFQLLFFLGFVHHLLAFRDRVLSAGSADARAGRALLVATLWLGALCLCKLLFVLLLPVLVVFALLVHRSIYESERSSGTVPPEDSLNDEKQLPSNFPLSRRWGRGVVTAAGRDWRMDLDRKSTRLNSSHT